MKKKILAATHAGDLEFGDISIPCSVLENGTRVLSTRGVNEALGGSIGGHRDRKARIIGVRNIPRILAASATKPFISNELTACLSSPIEFKPLHGGRSAFGYEAALLPQICEVILDAAKAGALKTKKVIDTAEILLRGFARVGIIGLIDEATGYQEIRDRLALQKILDKYLLEEHAKWAKRFPNEFYERMFELKGWQWRGMKVNRPSIVGRYTNNLVYERLAPGVLEELTKRNPADKRGVRKTKHHQWLTEDIGHPTLQKHLAMVVALMRVAPNWNKFIRSVERALPKMSETIPLPLDETG